VAKLNTVMVRVLNVPDVLKRLPPLAQVPVPGTATEFGGCIRAQ
jgi:hypothetical protein